MESQNTPLARAMTSLTGQSVFGVIWCIGQTEDGYALYEDWADGQGAAAVFATLTDALDELRNRIED